MGLVFFSKKQTKIFEIYAEGSHHMDISNPPTTILGLVIAEAVNSSEVCIPSGRGGVHCLPSHLPARLLGDYNSGSMAHIARGP